MVPPFQAALQGGREVQTEKGLFVFIFAKFWKAFNKSDMNIKIFISEKIVLFPIGSHSFKRELKSKSNKIRDSYS